jgi:hypothetical protein
MTAHTFWEHPAAEQGHVANMPVNLTPCGADSPFGFAQQLKNLRRWTSIIATNSLDGIDTGESQHQFADVFHQLHIGHAKFGLKNVLRQTTEKAIECRPFGLRVIRHNAFPSVMKGDSRAAWKTPKKPLRIKRPEI